MLLLGLLLTAATVLVLITAALRRRRLPFPAYGWVGIAILVVAEPLMFRNVWPINAYFTPIAWTAYLLLADALVFSLRGRSRLHDAPREFLYPALLSLPLWLIFELYNLRLQNWAYVGLPLTWPQALLGYGWAFSTITPAIFETADLIESFGWFAPAPPVRLSSGTERLLMLVGAACLVVPLVLPQHIAAYLFALVWVGFVLLLDPLNHRLGLPSLLGDLAAGRRSRLWSLFLAGWTCGWLWEFWNYWAAEKWHYIFPILQRWKVFEMPVPGYLGFLPFAWECFVMYVTASWILRRRPLAQQISQPDTTSD